MNNQNNQTGNNYNDYNNSYNNNNQGFDNNPQMMNQSQNDYYSNDAYYNNSNYSDSYNDTSYEEKNSNNKGMWWKILLVILILLIIILLLLKFCTGGSGNDKDKKYESTKNRICEAAEKYIDKNPTLLDKSAEGTSATIKLQRLADANLIEARIENPYYDGGLFKKSNESKYFSMDSSVRLTVYSGGTIGCELVDNSKDVTPPELRLNGDAEITLPVGTEFSDPGYTATDDYDGDITDKVVRSGNVDSSKAGEYTITYSVSDSAGNATTKTRKVIYEEYGDIEITLGSILDGVTPMISLKGSNPYCMVKGTQYVEPGAIATDNVDGDITNRIAVENKITGNLMGAFRVKYTVEDSSGNKAIAYRAVIVTTECPKDNNSGNNGGNNGNTGGDSTNTLANTVPVITLIGKNSVTITKGTEYIDLGATAYDKEDGDITSSIITDASAVNVNVAGVYKVHYRVTDSAGALATAVRTVTVKENVTGTPSVRFTSSKSNINILVGKGSDSLISSPSAVNENGVPVTVTRTIEDYGTKKYVSAIDWNSVGKYRVTYTATHANGSVRQSKTIIVTIYEDGATISGPDKITITRRDSNCDLTEADLLKAGIKFSEGSIVSIKSDKDRIACILGTYEVTVIASKGDTAPAEKKITVTVVEGTSTIDTSAPSKVIITGNSANPSSPYNINEKWVGGTITQIDVTFTSTPAKNTEIANFEWSADCNTVGGTVAKTSSTGGVLRWTIEGKNSVCIRAVTTAGTRGPWSDPVKLYIDLTGPKVAFTHTWKDGKEDWHSAQSLTLTYNATDNGSGLDHFEYTYDDVKAKKADEITTYNEATGSLTVKENTEPNRPSLFVFVRAVDKAGNKGEWTLNPAYANMDTTKPNTPSLKVEGDKTAVVKINAEFTDPTSASSPRSSGFGKLIYKIDNGEDKEEMTKTITAPSNTTQANVKHNIKVWAVDKAGNKSDNSAETNIEVAPGKKEATGVTIKNGNTSLAEAASCSTVKITVGDTITLTAVPIPADVDDKTVTWASSNASVAVIDSNGKITVKGTEEVTITAKIGNAKATCKIKAEAKVPSGGGGGYTPPVVCPENCKTCTSAGVCTECNTGYKVDNNGKCVLNVEKKTCWCADNQKCSVYSLGQKTEAECKMSCRGGTPGYNYQPKLSETCTNSTCNVANCAKCSVNGKCSECKNGYHFNNGVCEKNITCNVANCAYCRATNVCGTCKSGYHVEGAKCVKNATVTYTKTTKTCATYAGIPTGQCTYSNSTVASKDGKCNKKTCVCPSGYTGGNCAVSNGTCRCNKTVVQTTTRPCIGGDKNGSTAICPTVFGYTVSKNGCSVKKDSSRCIKWSAPKKESGLTSCTPVNTASTIVTCTKISS